MMKKEQWADEVLKSIEGIQRAIPKEHLFDKIMVQVSSKEDVRVIPLRYVKWIAAAAIMVFALNIYALKLHTNNVKTKFGSDDLDIQLMLDYTF